MTTVPVRQEQPKLTMNRFFTDALVSPDGSIDPLDAVEYEERATKIVNREGGVVFEMERIEAPKAWSQHATDIAASKYFRKAGVPPGVSSLPHENSVRQLVARVADSIAASGERQSYFSPESSKVFRDELAHLLIHQMAAFNSPVWFNCGLAEAYGIEGEPAGNWRWGPGSGDVVLAQDSYTYPQVSACFINKIEDDLMDIADHVKREMRIFKYGSGAGANFSALRGKGEKLSNGGDSSGLMSFLRIFDVAAGAIKSGGTTRRAAKMVVVDCDHPDIEEFINWKVKEEEKAKVLIAAGYDADFNGEAYQTISGQNANNSVSVTDEFMMRANGELGKGNDHHLFRRTDNEVHKTLDAGELLDSIAEAAWECADPGLHYSGNLNKWHTCKASGPIRASNPCSEYVFLDESACNLASLNLVKFASDDGVFDVKAFQHACRVLFLAQEILVDHASYPTEQIARNSHDYRTLGLGYANLGALLMRSGMPYASQEARTYAAGITSLMTATAYETSAALAAIKGPFRGFAHNRASMLEVMDMHRAAAQAVSPVIQSELGEAHRAAWDRVLVKGREHGFRNAQATLLAPTGTISFLMDCDTTGVEPDYMLVKHKKLAGGGKMVIVNQSVDPALRRLGYGKEQRNRIVEYLDGTHKMEGAPGLCDDHLAVFDCATKCGDGERFISAEGHVLMMAAVQPFLSGAISKTVNLPSNTTVEQIRSLYVDAWKLGIKCLAVFRDDSKGCQVLTGKEAPEELPRRVRKRLAKKRLGFTQEARVGGQKVYLRTGDYTDGKLGEIFIDMHKEGATMRSMTNCFAIAISIGLQYGVPLEEFVDAFTFTNFQPNGIVVGHPNIKHASSIIDYVFRVLAFEYHGRSDIVQVKPEPEVMKVAEVAMQVETVREMVSVSMNANLRDSRVCAHCGMLAYRKGGTCYSCGNCGTQTGCA